MELKTVFVDNNSDMECLDTISKSLPFEVLEKAFDRSKLVQKEITDKNGNRRKVWVKAGEDQKQSKPTKKTEEPKDTKPSKSSVDFTLPSHGDAKKAVIELASKHSKQDIIESAKKQGITWKENSHEGINWMRASMAIQKAMKNGTIGKTNETSKVDEKKPTAKKVENNSLSPKVFSEDGRVTSVTGGGSRGQLSIVRRGKSEYIMVQSTKKDGTFGKPMRVTLYGNETPQKALERMKSNNPDKQWRFDPDSLEPKKADEKTVETPKAEKKQTEEPIKITKLSQSHEYEFKNHFSDGTQGIQMKVNSKKGAIKITASSYYNNEEGKYFNGVVVSGGDEDEGTDWNAYLDCNPQEALYTAKELAQKLSNPSVHTEYELKHHGFDIETNY